MVDVLAGLPAGVRAAVEAAPEADTRQLLELRLSWRGLVDIRARVADRLRVFLLSWDPLGWLDDRGIAWATANGDGDDYEVVLYVLTAEALAMARSRESSLLEALAWQAESAIAVAGRYESEVRSGVYPELAARGAVPGMLSEPPERERLPAPTVELVHDGWEPIGLAVIQDLVQQASGPVDLDRTAVQLDPVARREPACPACAGQRFGFPADLQEHRDLMCPPHARAADDVTAERLERAARSNPDGWGAIGTASKRLDAPDLPADLERRVVAVLERGPASVGDPRQLRADAELVAELCAHVEGGGAGTLDDLWELDHLGMLPHFLNDLPVALAADDLHDLAAATCERIARAASQEAAPIMEADAAVFLAQGGRGSEATDRAEALRAAHPDDSYVAARAGDTFAAVGQPARAEEAYRAALALAADSGSPEEIDALTESLVHLLELQGRSGEVAAARRAGDALARRRVRDLRPAPRSTGPKVGRNDPCPCGSGRKHKRCCGA